VIDDITKPIRVQGVTRKGIEVGDDCWVGAKATFSMAQKWVMDVWCSRLCG